MLCYFFLDLVNLVVDGLAPRPWKSVVVCCCRARNLVWSRLPGKVLQACIWASQTRISEFAHGEFKMPELEAFE